MKLAKFVLMTISAMFLSLGAVAQETPESLDKKVREAYKAIDVARDAMNGELTDEERSAKMGAFQESCRKFVATYESKASVLNGGLFDLGRAAIQSFSPEKAIQFLQSFLAKNKGSQDSAEATMFLGDAYRAVNKNKEAIALYVAFIKENPKSEMLASARLGLATSHFMTLEFEEAITHYRDILTKHPKHEVSGDASFQLLNALVYAGRHDEARAHLAKLIESAPEAPELKQKEKQFELLGRPAPELTGVLDWQGLPGSNIARMKGRVLVLCFFMMKNIPCARTLQSLSELEKELHLEGVTVWGLSSSYKAGKGDWTVARESRWLGRYRENPRFVLQTELRYTPKGGDEEKQVWGPLEKPITVTLGLTKDFANLHAYRARRVPTIIVIGKDGRVALLEEGGQAAGGFQSQMLRRLIRRLAAK